MDVPELLDDAKCFGIDVRRDGGTAVVSLAGELDLASRDELIAACRSSVSTDVVIDLSQLVFMDCAGWGGLIEARASTLATLRGARGQPAHVMEMIGRLGTAGTDPRAEAAISGDDHLVTW